MKKLYLTALALAAVTQSYAQPRIIGPTVIGDVYSTKITSDGKWIGAHSSGISIYDVATEQLIMYPEGGLGIGNAISSNGIAVGSRNDIGVIVFNGRIITPEPLRNTWMSSVNGITPDGSRVVGYYGNPRTSSLDDENHITLLPFYCDVDSEGNFSEIYTLPHPTRDFLGNIPQNITASWISDDGKTIVGQIVDSHGAMYDPIVYKQGDNGEWTYILPSEKVFNPEHIEIPENPWTKMPDYPELIDYMDPVAYQQYIQDWYDYEDGYWDGDEPNPLDYMSAADAEAYQEALDEYNNFEVNHRAELQAYEKAFVQILLTSPLFESNDHIIDSKGKKLLCCTAGDQENGIRGQIYEFDLETGDYRVITSLFGSLTPRQLLSDGTIIAFKGLFSYEASVSYILLPGEEEFLTMKEYFNLTNPQVLTWLESIGANGPGLVSMSDDKKVITGGLELLHFYNPDSLSDYFMSYMITDANTEAGVETTFMAEQPEGYTVYNLQGVKVLQTLNKEDITSLPKGIYIVNGKKVAI